MIFLSVIIPTRDRANCLKGVLSSLTVQTYPPKCFEVLIVDNGSKDNTKEIFDFYSSSILNLHYYYDDRPGLHVGRHVGLREAKGDILVYADDDIEATQMWLEGIAESFNDKEVVLVGGKILPKYEVAPPDWIIRMWKEDENGNRILGYLSLLDLGDEVKEINPNYVFGCNFSIRKSTLLEAGGFHPDAMPQELIKYRGDGESHVSRFILSNGYKTIYNPKASVYHMVPSSRMTEEYFCRRAFNEGISYSYTELRNKFLRKDGTIKRYNAISFYYQQLKTMTIIELFKTSVQKIINILGVNLYNSHEYINKMIDKSFKHGKKIHNKEVKNDPKLLEWVLKSNYYG
jgi:glycosyltransferase involved in cell wall biosynthesis